MPEIQGKRRLRWAREDGKECLRNSRSHCFQNEIRLGALKLHSPGLLNLIVTRLFGQLVLEVIYGVQWIWVGAVEQCQVVADIIPEKDEVNIWASLLRPSAVTVWLVAPAWRNSSRVIG
jgi:hypothetical protein